LPRLALHSRKLPCFALLCFALLYLLLSLLAMASGFRCGCRLRHHLRFSGTRRSHAHATAMPACNAAASRRRTPSRAERTVACSARSSRRASARGMGSDPVPPRGVGCTMGSSLLLRDRSATGNAS
jgi:hypothetical protein